MLFNERFLLRSLQDELFDTNKTYKYINTPEYVEFIWELPGVKSSDIDLDVEGTQLRLKVKTSESSRKQFEFETVVHLPINLNLEFVDATLEDGLLVVKIMRNCKGTSKHIEVKSS